MKQKFVGTYELGHENIDIYLREGTGGEFYTTPEEGRLPRIKIGYDYKQFYGVLNVLIHEALELSLDRLRCRCEPSADLSLDHAQYIFIVNHVLFSEACMQLAMLIRQCEHDLFKAWKIWRKLPKN